MKPDDERKIRQLYYENKTAKEISLYLGLPYSSVLRVTKKAIKKYQDSDWLEENYISKNLSTTDLAKLANTSDVTISSYLKKYGIVKDRDKILEAHQEKVRRTCLNKYGVEHYFHTNDFIEKSKETSLNKYGTENPSSSDEVKKRIRETNLSKYGSETYLTSEEGLEKIKNINLSKYGSETFFASEAGQRKAAESLRKKYGESRPLMVKSFLIKQRETMVDRYGVEFPLQNQEIKGRAFETNHERYGSRVPTKNEIIKSKIIRTKIKNGHLRPFKDKLLSDLSRDSGVPISTLYYLRKKSGDNSLDDYIDNYNERYNNLEHRIIDELSLDFYGKYFDLSSFPELRYKPDFKVSSTLALNVDGLYWHSEKAKERLYHFNMRKDYESLGLRILQFREDEVRDKIHIIKSMINNLRGESRQKIFARKCLVRDVIQKDADGFYNHNHMMGTTNGKHIGLYYQERLVSLISYRTYKDKIKVERFCSEVDTVVTGGLSRLLNKIPNSNYLPIHYWVDLRYGTGNHLLKRGFNFSKETLGWKWTDGYNTYNRLACRANMKGSSLSQREQAEQFGWYKIYDAGQRLYIRS